MCSSWCQNVARKPSATTGCLISSGLTAGNPRSASHRVTRIEVTSRSYLPGVVASASRTTTFSPARW